MTLAVHLAALITCAWVFRKQPGQQGFNARPLLAAVLILITYNLTKGIT